MKQKPLGRLVRRRSPIWAAVVAVPLLGWGGSSLAATYYWDANGPAPGAGTTPTGTWGSDNFWNTDPLGGNGTFVTTLTDTDVATFSAGGDATGGYVVNVTGEQLIRSLVFEEGPVTLNGGSIKLAGTQASFGGNGDAVINTSLTATTFVKSGSGSLTLNNLTLSDNITVAGGTLRLAGETIGPVKAASVHLVGGTLILDNTGFNDDDRLSHAGGSMAFNTGTFILLGNSSADSSERIRNLNSFQSGHSTITLELGGTHTLTLWYNAFARAPGDGTAFINGTNLGMDETSTASVARMRGNTPDLVGTTAALGSGINAGVHNTVIVPYFTGEASTETGLGTATGIANTFLTFHGTGTTGTGFRPLSPIHEFTQNSIVAGDNTRITTATSASTTTAINSLVIAGGDLSIDDGVTLTNTSGALLFTTNNAVKPTGTSGVLALGTTEGVVTVNSGVTATISAKITGAMLNKSGHGTLILTNDNDYTGSTVISAGVLRIAHADAIPGLIVLNGGVLGLELADFTRGLGTGPDQFRFHIGTSGSSYSNPYGGGFAAYGSVDRTVNIGGSGATVTWANTNFLRNGSALILGADDATRKITFANAIALNGAVRTVDVRNGSAPVDGELSGILSGTGASGLMKVGQGTLLLSNANTYAGETIIDAGTLAVTGSLAESSTVTVNKTATLAGTGTVNGAVVVAPGATIAPGLDSTPSSFTLGSLTFNGGGKLLINIDTATQTADRLVIANGVNLGTSAVLELALSGGEGATGPFTILQNNSGVDFDFTTNYFAGLVPDENGIATFNNGPFTFTVNYNFTDASPGGDGLSNDIQVAFSAVPEPASLGLIALAGAGLLGRRRRRA